MTLEEARKVKVGDWIETLAVGSNRRWHLVEVENVIGFHGSVRFQVREVLKSKRRRKLKNNPLMDRTIDRCRTTSFLPQPANIYADWLEENGEPEAARKLREQFPI